MIQAIIKRGKVIAEEVPSPNVQKGFVLIKVVNSCISSGTEISGVHNSGKSFIKKALEKPENISKAIDKAKTEGIDKVISIMKGQIESSKKDAENGLPTGYSVSGIVVDLGEGINEFEIGDRVAAAGAGFANHAGYVNVPVNLVVKIQKGLSFQEASTTTIGSIALQGVRRADIKLGEFGVVYGTGIIGLITVQMLKSSGVRVAAIDINQKRLDIAKEYGAEIIINTNNDDQNKKIESWTNGYGADAVLFTAATNDSVPLSNSFKMCKKKGKVVLVGVSGMEIKRDDMYQKELDFLISTSYGPGRYDKQYEEKGTTYPYAYVRWTEKRNLEEYLRLVAAGNINLDKIINAVYPIEKVSEAFEALETGTDKPLMVILDYGVSEETKLDGYNSTKKITLLNHLSVDKDVINIGLVGTGNFAVNVHLPNIEKLKNKYRLYAVMNHSGLKAKNIAVKYGADYATTNYEDILSDKNIDMVFICTRHDSHASLILQALQAGKNVFVEKPLATNMDDLHKIEDFYKKAEKNKEKAPTLMVGFNRRFSPYAQEIKKHTDKRINPLFIHYRMNAGFTPLDSWVHECGGRIVGEACHIIDLMHFFTCSEVKSISYESLTPTTGKYSKDDNKAIILKYKDGSVCCIDYFANGSRDLPKEYMEVHFDDKSIIMNDYKSLKGYSIKIDEINTKKSEKGHYEELNVLFDFLTKKDETLKTNLEELFNTTYISLTMS